MILKFSETPTPVLFREGIKGTDVESQFGGQEVRHFVNQHRDQKDTIFIPLQAQAQLEELAPGTEDTVLISRNKIKNKWQWDIRLAQPSDANYSDDDSKNGRYSERPLPHYATPAQAFNPRTMTYEAPTRNVQHIARQVEADERQAKMPIAENQAHRPEAKNMAGALLTAHEAAGIFERQTGLRLSEDKLCSLAITLYIEACKQRATQEGRRAA